MLAEFDSDVTANDLYPSKDFSESGVSGFPSVLRAALASGTVDSLAESLPKSFFNPTRTDKNQKVTTLNLTDSASKFASGEFSRFYLRGLCLYAKSKGVTGLIVYRAKASSSPRQESESKLGTSISVDELLQDLRDNKGSGPILGLGYPHSGLSACLPKDNS